MLKFRLSARDRNNATNPSGDASEENARLMLEIQQLRRQLESNPELTRYAYENMRLREKMQRYEHANALIESKAAELDSRTIFEQSLISKILELEGLKCRERHMCLNEQCVQTDIMEMEQVESVQVV